MRNIKTEVVYDEAPVQRPSVRPVLSRRSRRQLSRTQGVKFERAAGSLKPFKHSQALHGKIIDALAKNPKPIDQQLALEALPHYASRGHGGRHRSMQRLVTGRSMQDRSRYLPREEDAKHARPSA